MRSFSLAVVTLLLAGAADAEPLADMAGTWRGSGWAREAPGGPQETVRCQLRNVYDASSQTLKLRGQCVVPGRRIAISGALEGTAGSEKIAGRWSNPDGIGSVSVVGIQRNTIVACTFCATDPTTGRDLAQNVEWRVSNGELRLRSTDRGNSGLIMSDISFVK